MTIANTPGNGVADDKAVYPYVFKPVDGSGGKGIVIGPAATEATLADLRVKVLGDPAGGSPRSGWHSRPRRRSSTAGWVPAISTCARSR